METEQTLVHEFHRKYGFPRNVLFDRNLSREQWLDLWIQRDRLISEEHNELRTAWHAKDKLAIADALGDLAYVVLGTSVAVGIDLGPIVREIHASNMTKDVGLFKPVKGKDFRHPQLEPLLIKQGLITL